MSHNTTPPSLESPLRSVALAHAGGMKSISRRLSAATPPEPSIKHIASQRDASPQRAISRYIGSFSDIPPGCGPFRTLPGGVADAQPPANRGDASGIGSVALWDSGHSVEILFAVGAFDRASLGDVPPWFSLPLQARRILGACGSTRFRRSGARARRLFEWRSGAFGAQGNQSI